MMCIDHCEFSVRLDAETSNNIVSFYSCKDEECAEKLKRVQDSEFRVAAMCMLCFFGIFVAIAVSVTSSSSSDFEDFKSNDSYYYSYYDFSNDSYFGGGYYF